MPKKPQPDRVSEAFNRVLEDLRLDRDTERTSSRRPSRVLGVIWALLLALLISAASIALLD